MNLWLQSGFPPFVFYTRRGFWLITFLQQIKDCSFTNGIKTLINIASNHIVFPQRSIPIAIFPQPSPLPAVHLGSDVAQLKATEKSLINFRGSWITHWSPKRPAAENLRSQWGILKHHEAREIFLACDFLLFCYATGMIL